MVSSANKEILGIEQGRSLTYVRKSRGPKMEPWLCASLQRSSYRHVHVYAIICDAVMCS